MGAGSHRISELPPRPIVKDPHCRISKIVPKECVRVAIAADFGLLEDGSFPQEILEDEYWKLRERLDTNFKAVR